MISIYNNLIIDRIVSQVDRRVDESSPMVDARSPEGSRVNPIIPPLALDGPALSIRRFGKKRFTNGRPGRKGNDHCVAKRLAAGEVVVESSGGLVSRLLSAFGVAPKGIMHETR